MNTTPMSFPAAMRDYFGFLPGQNLSSFVAEIKALNEADKAFFSKELTRVGYVLKTD